MKVIDGENMDKISVTSDLGRLKESHKKNKKEMKLSASVAMHFSYVGEGLVG